MILSDGCRYECWDKEEEDVLWSPITCTVYKKAMTGVGRKVLITLRRRVQMS